jgi:hypothetical protein
MAKARTIPHSPPADHPNLAAVCRDLDEWPRSWMGFPEDISPGEQIVAAFRPFLLHLVALQLSRKTLRKHVDNLWLLGGELIRDVNNTPALRKRPIADLVFEAVEEGGPLLYHGDSETEQHSFDSTCRKLRRFLEQQPH